MDINTEITNWLHSQQNWIQFSVEKILSKTPINEETIIGIVEYLKTEQGQKTDSLREFSGFLDEIKDTSILHLDSLGDIQGIDNLAPRKPVSFGDNNLTIIYGGNGSGKSGYTRILKKICGMENTPPLKANVFKNNSTNQSCSIKYTLNKNKKEVTWFANNGTIEELKAIDVFDSDSGKIYLHRETEVSYVPEAMSLFEGLVSIISKVKSQLEIEKRALVLSKLPYLPSEYNDTEIGKKYRNLYAYFSEKDVISNFSFSGDDKKQCNILEERLKTKTPLLLSKKKIEDKKQVDLLIEKIKKASNGVSEKTCEEIFKLQMTAIEKRRIAVEGADITKNTSEFEGIGSNTWNALWTAASDYSQEYAYKDKNFPNTEDSARCVLCHQVLKEEAKKRLSNFQSFVLSKLETQAYSTKKAYEDSINNLPVIESDEEIETIIKASGLEKDEWFSDIIEIFNQIKTIKEKLSTNHDTRIEGLSFPIKVIKSLNDYSGSLGKIAIQLENDAKEFDIEAENKKLNNSKAKEWISSYVNEIVSEISRLNKIDTYADWILKTNTGSISRKAGELSQVVITDAYVERFNDELKSLGAKHLQVDLVKTRVSQGKVKHQVKLQGQIQQGEKVQDILSEGEQRIVSLAAFLADVTCKNINAPFIFDDPISSLDQIFEEQTINRLIRLSAKRQVLIFTHRLSFLGLTADRSNPHQVHIKREVWGTGEPGEIPLFGKKPINALKNLKNERLHKAKKVLNETGSEDYYPLAKAICSDVRILMERIVEFDFLADVIQRHRRSINTMGKINNLAKITKKDCDLVNEIMTEYSCYEHSQPIEIPINIPDPQAIEASIDRVLAWHDEFKSRAIA